MGMRRPAAGPLWIALGCLLTASVGGQTPAYYTYDGRGNNVDHPDWGAAGTELIRKQVTSTAYADGVQALAGPSRPGAREVSARLSLPALRSQPNSDRGVTDMITYIGQFFDHEFDLTKGDSGEDADIPIPRCDEKYDPTCSGTAKMHFQRSDYNRSAAVGAPRQQINAVTAFLDGSVVYGSSKQRGDALRAFYKGRLSESPGRMLPDNFLGIGMENPAAREEVMKAAGDVRANVHPPMLSFQTLFLREHNRLASKFHDEDPSLSDEQLFWEARKWTVAFMQQICFYEYLPALGIVLDAYAGYDPDVNPSIDNFFATVSYRYGHSEVKEIIFRVDDDGHEIADGHLLIYQSYFSPAKSLNADIDPILRGLAMKVQAKVDPFFASSIQHHLFGDPLHGGSDLVARDIQRSRDHGTADYNTARAEMGLPKASSFSDISSDVYTQRLLESLYGTVDNLDAYVGAMAEDILPGANFGPLFFESMKDQYQRIRDGDRFYFENVKNGLFTAEEIKEIRSTGLRDVILRNTNIRQIPANLFIMDPDNPWPTEVDVEAPREGGSEEVGKTTITLKGDATLTYWMESSGGVDEVHFDMSAPAAGWIGLGFAGPSGKMIDADVIIGAVRGQEGEVYDSWSSTFAAPAGDVDKGGTDDATLVEAEEADGATRVHFKRPLSASDELDRDILLDVETPIIFAWHDSSDDLAYHGPGGRGSGAITVTPAGGGGEDGGEPGGESGGDAIVGGSLDLADGDYRVSWTVDAAPGRRRTLADGQMVHFTVTAKGEGWAALGVAGPAGGMIGADIIIGSINGDTCQVHDYWSDAYAAPQADADLGETDDVHDASCTRSDGTTEFKFSRPVQASGEKDHSFNAEGATPLIYAWHPTSDTLQYHGMTRGSAEAVTAELGSEQPPSDGGGGDSPPSSGGGGGEGGGATDDSLVFAEAPLSSAFTLMWAKAGQDEIVIQYKGSSDAWMGLGLEPEDGGMTNSDMYIGYIDGGTVHVGDYYSTGYQPPGSDAASGGNDDILEFGGSMEDGVTTVWFRRKLDTGDSFDSIIRDESIPIVYAWGSSPQLGYHGPTQRGGVAVNLYSAEAKISKTADIGRRMIESHGGVMVLAWAFVGIIGVGIARFGRQWRWWLKAHRFLQIGTTVIALIGEVIGFSYTKGSFRTAHSITALCVVFVTFPQVSLGAAAMRKSSNPNYNKLHRGTGYFLVGLALWQVWTGLITLEVGSKIKNMYLAWVLACLIAFHFSSMGVSQREVDNLLKSAQAYAPAAGEAGARRKSRKSMRRGAQGDGGSDPSTAAIETDRESRRSRKEREGRRSAARSLRANSKSSELLDLFIENGSTDGGSTSDYDSDGRTGFSETADDDSVGEATLTSEEFLVAVQEGKKWTIINDVVYDLTFYMTEHPGGAKVLEDIVGIDGTDPFLEIHGGDRKVMKLLQSLMVGDIMYDEALLGRGDRDQSSMLIDQNETTEEAQGDKSSFTQKARSSVAAILGATTEELETQRSSEGQEYAPLLGDQGVIPSASMDDGHGDGARTWRDEMQTTTLDAQSSAISLIPTASEMEARPPTGLDRRRWIKMEVVSVLEINDDVVGIQVSVPGGGKVELPVTSHIMIRGRDPQTSKNVVRSFTPIIPDQVECPGIMYLVIKCYADGRMSRYIRTLREGGEIEIKGPVRSLKYFKGKYQRIVLIGGGSGITPLWQVAEAIIKDPEDETRICLIYQNRFEKDILMRSELDEMAAQHPKKIRVLYMLSKPPEGWPGGKGRLDRAVLQSQLPPAELPGSVIMICGPPGMIDSLAGPMDEETRVRDGGLLHQMGFSGEQIHVFE